MAKLLQILKSLGYECFYDELPSCISPGDFIKRTWRVQKNESTEQLMKGVLEHKIEYQGIDLDWKLTENLDVACAPWAEVEVCRYEGEFLEALVPVRDKVLANAYISESKNVFGRSGMTHAPGIQHNILKHFSPDEAVDNFSFFCVYNSSEFKPLLLDTPLKMILADAKQNSDDEIIKIVIDEISKKSKDLNFKGKKTISVKSEIVDDKVVKETIRLKYQTMGLDFSDLRREAIETFIEPTNTQHQKNINNARLTLLRYLYERFDEKFLRGKNPEYFTFFGKLKGMTYSVKESAAKKMINLLKGKRITPLSDNELEALRDCRLGNIISKMESISVLPEQFIRSENIKTMRELRLMR